MTIGEKNQQDLAEFLGPDYSVRVVDIASCVFRRLNDRFDIEIVGTTRRNGPFSVYVWDVPHVEHEAARLLDVHQDIPGQAALKELLDGLVRKYGTGNAVNT